MADLDALSMSLVRHYPTQPILAASIAVFRGERVLLGRRHKPPAQALYSLPGGVVELGETLEAAALRELYEETQIDAQIMGCAGWRDLIHRDAEGRVERHFVIACFAARWRAGEGQPSAELDPLIWAAKDDHVQLPLTEGLACLIAQARALV